MEKTNYRVVRKFCKFHATWSFHLESECVKRVGIFRKKIVREWKGITLDISGIPFITAKGDETKAIAWMDAYDCPVYEKSEITGELIEITLPLILP